MFICLNSLDVSNNNGKHPPRGLYRLRACAYLVPRPRLKSKSPFSKIFFKQERLIHRDRGVHPISCKP